jgi:hypothetical protein
VFMFTVKTTSVSPGAMESGGSTRNTNSQSHNPCEYQMQLASNFYPLYHGHCSDTAPQHSLWFDLFFTEWWFLLILFHSF